MNGSVSLGGVLPGATQPRTAAGAAQTTAIDALPGTVVDAEVVQVLAANPQSAAAAADSRFQVQVMLRLGEAVVTATLPGPPPQVGSRLSLIYLGLQRGQPQFLLAPATPQAAAQPQLSAPARLLGLLQQMQAASPDAAAGSTAPTARAAAPVWTDPAPPPQQAAQRLADALVRSGLFYESQLSAWAQGRQSLEALLAQPQGRLSALLQQGQPAAPALQTPQTPAPAAAQTPAPSAPQGATPAAAPAVQNALHSPSPPLSPAAAQTAQTPRLEMPALPQHRAIAAYGAVQSAPQTASDAAQLLSRLPAELHGIVQQQLQALMHGQVVWEGMLWPGQTLRWSLRPDPDGGAAHGAARAPRSWTTQLALDLPQLGAVRAWLRLSGNRIDLQLQRDAQAQQRIDPALPQLYAALRQAGLEVGAVHLGPLVADQTA
jgi:hypothetical protein